MTGISQAFTAALFHFLWQGAAVAAAFSVAMLLLKRRSPNHRYTAGCIALAIMAGLPVFTAWAIYEPAPTGEVTVTISDEVSALPVIDPDSSKVLSQITTWDAVRDWAIPAWSLGVLLFSIRLLWGYGHVRRLRRSAVADEHALRTAIRLAERLGIGRRLRVMVTAFADTPGVVGWIRPVILLPPATALGLTPEQLEAVLAHELAHIRRYDYLVNLMQTLIEALLFYHPAVWWVSSRIRHERELCCDDVAVETLGSPMRYARALTALERLRLGPPRLAMGAADGSLSHRVRRIMGKEVENNRLSVIAGVVALVLGAVVLGCSPTVIRAATPLQSTWIPAPPPAQASFPSVPAPPPPPPPPPAPPAAPAPAWTPASALQSFFGWFDDDDDVRWVLFRDGETMIRGSSFDRADARNDRRRIGGGDMLWVRFEGEAYVIQEESFLDGIDALFEPMEEYGDQMRELGDEMRELGDQMRDVRVDVPDMGPQLERLRTMLASDASARDLGRLQAEIGRLQGEIGRIQGAAGRRQAAIGQEQAEIGRQQAAVGRQQADAAHEMNEDLARMIEEAIGSGLAERID